MILRSCINYNYNLLLFYKILTNISHYHFNFSIKLRKVNGKKKHFVNLFDKKSWPDRVYQTGSTRVNEKPAVQSSSQTSKNPVQSDPVSEPVPGSTGWTSWVNPGFKKLVTTSHDYMSTNIIKGKKIGLQDTTSVLVSCQLKNNYILWYVIRKISDIDETKIYDSQYFVFWVDVNRTSLLRLYGIFVWFII